MYDDALRVASAAQADRLPLHALSTRCCKWVASSPPFVRMSSTWYLKKRCR